MNKLSLTVIVVFTTLFTSQSQVKVWTLNDCINHALQNDLNLKQLDLDKKVSRKRVMAQYGTLLPSVSLFTNHNYNFGSTIDPTSNARISSDIQSNSFSLSGDLGVFDWGNFVRIKKARLEQDKAQYDLEIQQNELIIQIAQAFYRLQYDKEQLNVIENQIKNTKKHLLRIEKEIKEGVKSNSDLYDMQANITNDEQQKVETENNYKTSYLKLQNLLDVTDSIEFKMTLTSFETKPDTENLEALYQKGLPSRPEVKASELQKDIQKKTVQENRSQYLPTLNANFSYSTFYVKTLQGVDINNIPFDTQFNDNQNKFLGFSLNIPVFNKLQTNTNLQISKIELEKATIALDLQKQLYYETLKEAWQQTDNTFKRWNSSERNLEAQYKSYTTVEKRFEAGLIDSFSYFNSKNNLLSAEYTSLRSKYEYLYNASLLTFYVSGKF